MQIIIPQIFNNAIIFPFGLKLKLIQVSGNKKSDVTLTLSPNEDVFYGLFDSVDTDFEILMDNTSNQNMIVKSDFSIRFGSEKTFVDILPNPYIYYWKALETNGRRLHFVSQQTDEGKVMVAMSATQMGTTYAEEAINCSRIGFRFEIEDKKMIKIFIRQFTGIIMELTPYSDCSVDELKTLLMQKEGIPRDKLRLIFNGRELVDGTTLDDYNIKDSSVLLSILRLRGGDSETNNIPGVPENVGEIGVVCFGEKTEEKFGVYNRQFIASKEYEIKPFSIELRMKSKYSMKSK